MVILDLETFGRTFWQDQQDIQDIFYPIFLMKMGYDNPPPGGALMNPFNLSEPEAR